MKPKLLLGLVLLLGGLALCGAGLWLLFSPPQYAATARIKLEADEPDSSGYGGFGGYFPQIAFEIIQSRLVLSNVVAGLNLNEVWGEKYSNGEPLKYAECYVIIKSHLRLTLGAFLNQWPKARANYATRSAGIVMCLFVSCWPVFAFGLLPGAGGAGQVS